MSVKTRFERQSATGGNPFRPKELLVPLDESDLIAHCERQDQKIRELEAALAEKEADWQLKYDLLTHDYEQKWGLSNRLQEQIAVLEMAVKEKDKVIRESCVIIAEGIKVVEGLEKQITDLSAERDNERKIKEAEKKILLDEVTKNKRLREDVRELRRALSNYNPDHEALRDREKAP